MIVSVRGVVKNYIIGKNTVNALKGVDLSVEKGEFLAISGPSGSGKTTLLNIIGCIERPTSGVIEIDGASVEKMTDNQLSDLRAQKLSFIFQSFNLLPVLSALENVEYPLSHAKISARERRGRALAALDSVGLGSHGHHRPLELSGGQRQRVAIARAIVTRPAIILADEPTANLDHTTGEEILDLMQNLNKQNGTTFIFSTHDKKVMDRASRVVPLWDGKLVS